jgi:predicted PurR-regulated permease PerM
MKHIRNDLLPLALMAAIIIGTLVVFWKLLDVAVLSVSLAVVLFPLHSYCSRSINRYLSAALVTAFIFVLFTAAVIFSFIVFSENSSTIQGIIVTIQSWIQNPATDPRVFGLPFERQQVDTWMTQAEALFVRYWYTVTSDIVMIALKIVVFFASLYVFLLHGIRIRDGILSKIPEDLHGRIAMMSNATVDTLYAIYVVHVGIAALTFVIAIPFFLFLGYGNVLFYSFLCAFCELIPVLGSSVVFIFLGTYALSIGDINGVFILFFFGYIGVSALPEIYVRPVLMGRRVRLHPLIMLVGFFGGIITMGMAGFVLGPVLMVLLFTGYKILIDEKKGTIRQQENGAGQT